MAVDDKYKFEEIGEDDDGYNEDYTQYILYVTIGDGDLKRGDFEFFISDGLSKYKNGNDYIAFSEVGTYKILFSEEHIYGRGRHYRYILTSSGEECEEVEISTRAEFEEFAKNCNSSADYSVNKSFYLTADIDFSGTEFTKIELFCGNFYGGYHTLSGIKISEDKSENVGVFCVVAKGARIERLNIKSCVVSSDGGSCVGVIGKNFGTVYAVNVSGSVTGDSYTGGIVGYNGKSLIQEDDEAINSSESYVYGVTENCSSSASVNGKVHTGGIAGFSSGKIISCKNTGKVNVKKYSSSESVVNVGGIVGYNAGRVLSCVNNGGVGYDNIGVYVGGIIGFSSGEVYFSENNGGVSASAYTGGIVGYAGVIKRENSSSNLNAYFGGMDYEEFISKYFGDGGDDFTAENDDGVYNIIYCINGGEVSAETYTGGIVGFISADVLKVNGCISCGDITASAGSYSGGICAYQNGGSIINCVSSGNIKADGFSAGKYVGGIVGYGNNVKYSFSSAVLIGEDYIGGIAGYASGNINGCYSNVSVVSEGKHVGGIAGFAASYDETINSFASVSDNFYIGEFGGISGMDYGSGYDFAAVSILSERLISNGMLSPYLSLGFSSDYWEGGDGEYSYPILSCFEKSIDCDDFDDEEEFEKYFSLFKDGALSLCKKYASVTHTVVFLEWNEDNGDLYDDDGKLLTENFEIVAVLRLYSGETADKTPDFVYAEEMGSGHVYEGKKAYYSVSWSGYDPCLQENFKVYAAYTQRVNSVNDGDKLFAEGVFDVGTEVELEQSGDYYSAEFLLNGQKINPSYVTLKVFVGDDADKYTLFLIDGGEKKEISFDVSGKYISFSYDGGFFALEKEEKDVPFWAWIITGVVSGAAVSIITVVVSGKIGKRSAEKRRKGK